MNFPRPNLPSIKRAQPMSFPSTPTLKIPTPTTPTATTIATSLSTSANLVIPSTANLPVIPNMRRTKQPPNTTIPNQTLYIRNLNERKNPKALMRNLHTIFSVFGKIVEIKAKRSLASKGQAFILFEDVKSAEKAVKEGQGVVLFDKVVDVQFANNSSFQVATLDGTLERVKEERDHRKSISFQTYSFFYSYSHYKEIKREEFVKKSERKVTMTQKEDQTSAPNCILFIQNLPTETTGDQLALLFEQYNHLYAQLIDPTIDSLDSRKLEWYLVKGILRLLSTIAKWSLVLLNKHCMATELVLIMR